MADEKAPETNTPDPAAEAAHPAKPGVKDQGHNVTTGGGERVDGRIADIADGD